MEDRTSDWLDFYRVLFGFTVLPQGKYFGVLPKGTLLESPCHKFYLQLIEPPPGAEDIHWEEGLVRVGLGAPNIPAATRALKERGIVFIDHGAVQPSDKGALTQVYMGAVTFELVVSHLRS
jgi:4-hydroxyphenylpyruvate dioxygenase